MVEFKKVVETLEAARPLHLVKTFFWEEARKLIQDDPFEGIFRVYAILKEIQSGKMGRAGGDYDTLETGPMPASIFYALKELFEFKYQRENKDLTCHGAVHELLKLCGLPFEAVEVGRQCWERTQPKVPFWYEGKRYLLAWESRLPHFVFYLVPGEHILFD